MGTRQRDLGGGCAAGVHVACRYIRSVIFVNSLANTIFTILSRNIIILADNSQPMADPTGMIGLIANGPNWNP